MRLFILAFFMTMLLLNHAVLASGGSGLRKIERVIIDNDVIAILPTAPFENPDSCDRSDIAIVLSTQAKQEFYLSAALTAKTTKDDVWMWFAGCTTRWNETYPIIVRLDVHS